jgi:hypothetical protein
MEGDYITAKANLSPWQTRNNNEYTYALLLKRFSASYDIKQDGYNSDN